MDLDRVVLRSTVKTEWTGPKEDAHGEEGLKIQSRRFLATLDPSGTPGGRTAEVVLLDGEQRLLSHILNWEVVPVLTASPGMVVFRTGEGGGRVLIRASDQKPFRVERVECPTAGVRARPAGDKPSVTQIIVIEGAPRPGVGRGALTVFTDHPSLKKVDVPFIVLE